MSLKGAKDQVAVSFSFDGFDMDSKNAEAWMLKGWGPVSLG
jgi:hypothetical protein